MVQHQPKNPFNPLSCQQKNISLLPNEESCNLRGGRASNQRALDELFAEGLDVFMATGRKVDGNPWRNRKTLVL